MSEMTARERYHAVMRREPGIRTLLWEFAYWSETIDRWYQEGLPRSSYAPPPGGAAGSPVFGEGLVFASRIDSVGYRDLDVHSTLGFDTGSVGLPLNWRHCPLFTETVLEEDDQTKLMVNDSGVTVRIRKSHDSIPQELDWPVRDRAGWEQIKAERFGPDIKARFPDRWDVVAGTYDGRDFPLGLIMDGFFSCPRELMGLTRQLMMYYDDPQLMHDINSHLASVWLAMLEEVTSKVQLDFVYIWEDMSFKNGPMLSPRLFEEFIVPYYRRVTGFLRERDVSLIFVDTDGDCRLLIPGFLRAGVAGLYPFEVQAGMDIVEIRRQYPQLLIQGGLDKNKVAQGKEAIDAELAAKLPALLSQGGYIPYCDHLVPPTVSWDNYRYFRQRIGEYVERFSIGTLA